MHTGIKTLNNAIKEIEQVRQYATGEELTKLSIALYEHQTILRLIDKFTSSQMGFSTKFIEDKYSGLPIRKGYSKLVLSEAHCQKIHKLIKSKQSDYRDVSVNLNTTYSAIYQRIKKYCSQNNLKMP